MKHTLVVLSVLALLTSSANAAELTGTVVSITDGDTLTLLNTSHHQVNVRLTEIDAPEKAQPFGKRSRESLGELCHRKPARVVTSSTDRYGRTLGRVYCAGVDANAEQIRRGMAWVYDKHVTDRSLDRSLYAVKDAARNAHTGLWRDPEPVAPWEYRAIVTAHRRPR